MRPLDSIYSNLVDVKEMHLKFKMPLSGLAEDKDRFNFRHNFLLEEIWETTLAKDLDSLIDGLIDTNYIIVGSLVEAGDAYKFRSSSFDSAGIINKLEVYQFLINTEFRLQFYTKFPVLQSKTWEDFTQYTEDLTYLYTAIVDFFDILGLDYNLHWSAVHKANMAKQLATEDNPSSRGSTGGDLIKPPEWKAPNHLKIIELTK